MGAKPMDTFTPMTEMPSRTLDALKGSIKKWERIVAGKDGDQGSVNCPLCWLFNVGWGDCDGCPVEAVTSHSRCLGTPYDVWVALREDDVEFRNGKTWAVSPRAVEVAQAELDFLKSLLSSPDLRVAA